jgi:hypothetical protein
LRVTYLRRPHWSARNADVKQLQVKPTVPYTPARQRIVFEFIPRDLYKIAAQRVSLMLHPRRRRILTLVIRNDIRASKRSHRLYPNSHQNAMLEKSPDLSVRLDLSLHLILNLSLHKCKLLMHLLQAQVPSNLNELESGFLDLAIPD